jgi:hypothetical protein
MGGVEAIPRKQYILWADCNLSSQTAAFIQTEGNNMGKRGKTVLRKKDKICLILTTSLIISVSITLLSELWAQEHIPLR